MAQWMKTEVAFGRHEETPIQDALADLALADAAATGAVNPEIAVFTRNDEYDKTTLLLTPAAAKFVQFLPGEWSVSEDHQVYEWGGLYTNGARPEDLGLKVRSR